MQLSEIIRLIIEALAALPSAISAILKIIDAIKGVPAPVRKEALAQGIIAMKKHCDGVGCELEIKKD